MKNIRLFEKWMCSVMTLVLVLFMPLAQVQAQQEVDGKITFKIEKKTMSMQEAQTAFANEDAIPLKVSLIFEGEWVKVFDELNDNTFIALNSSAFAFGIAQNGEGRTDLTAPLERNNPPAYIYASSNLHCSADGKSLDAPASPGMYLRAPKWEEHNNICPTYSYGALFTGSEFNLNDSFLRRTSHEGKECYELDLFNISFRLKDLQTVYVRGIDCNTAKDLEVVPDAESTDKETDLDGSTVGTTIMNIVNANTSRVYRWPNSYSTEAADWTLAPADYYGGVIPGGIFIEQVPELTQFERSMIA